MLTRFQRGLKLKFYGVQVHGWTQWKGFFRGVGPVWRHMYVVHLDCEFDNLTGSIRVTACLLGACARIAIYLMPQPVMVERKGVIQCGDKSL